MYMMYMFFSVLASWLLTKVILRQATRHGVLDVPNERSSHNKPVALGGGLAIASVFIIVMAILTWEGIVDVVLLIALSVPAGLVALVGVLDDKVGIRPSRRLAVHFLSSMLALICLGGAPPVEFLGSYISTHWLLDVVAFFALVWVINLYNFMDGINGLAGVEAISVLLAAAILIFLVFDQVYYPAVVLSGATLGFLFWNFPNARIFMGDGGSGFVGLSLGVMTLYSGWIDSRLLWAWIILLGVFVVDSTVTLIVRIMRGEAWYAAHRSHAYQNLSRILDSHTIVTASVAAVNILWLFPFALLVALEYLDGFLGMLLSYSPLVLLVMRLKGGKELKHT